MFSVLVIVFILIHINTECVSLFINFWEVLQNTISYLYFALKNLILVLKCRHGFQISVFLCIMFYYVLCSGQGCEHVFVCMGLLCAWTFFFAAPFRDFHCDQIFRVARCLLYKAIIFYKSHFWNPTSYFVEVGF